MQSLVLNLAVEWKCIFGLCCSMCAGHPRWQAGANYMDALATTTSSQVQYHYTSLLCDSCGVWSSSFRTSFSCLLFAFRLAQKTCQSTDSFFLILKNPFLILNNCISKIRMFYSSFFIQVWCNWVNVKPRWQLHGLAVQS